jgi:hypothetical protein
VFINALLDVGQQIGSVLQLVQDDGRRVHRQEATRVGRRRGSDVGQFQRDIAGGRAEGVLQQCGFAGLAWPGQDHRGELGGSLSQDWPRHAECNGQAAADLYLQLCITNAHLQRAGGGGPPKASASSKATTRASSGRERWKLFDGGAARQFDNRHHTLYSGILLIRRSKHRGLKRLYERDDRSGIRPDLVGTVQEILTVLDRAATPQGLNLTNGKK